MSFLFKIDRQIIFLNFKFIYNQYNKNKQFEKLIMYFFNFDNY